MVADVFQVAVYYADEREYDEAVLFLDKARGIETFNGVMQGWATRAGMSELFNRGITFRLACPGVFQTTSLLDVVAAPAIIEDLKQAGLRARLRPDGGIKVVDQPAEHLDPLIHAYGEYDSAPDPGGGRESAPYFVRLIAPITEEQRLELYHEYGVDIGAFIPPDRYRAFLDRDQHARVRVLPFVRDVERYRFESSVTPELVNALTDPDRADQIGTFDCVLFREGDLEEMVSRINASQGAEILDTSNLRIRFTAPNDPALLSALATLPPVRKLSSYEPRPL